MVELLPGSGVYLYQRHLAEAAKKASSPSPASKPRTYSTVGQAPAVGPCGKKMARSLFSAFNKYGELAAKKSLTDLDVGVVDAIIGQCVRMRIYFVV